MKRFYYYSFSMIVWISLARLYMLSLLKPKHKSPKGIAILPYYPLDWPGGDRTAGFQEFFLNDGIPCDVFAPWNSDEIAAFLGTRSVRYQYKIYYKILFSRIQVIANLGKYETAWIQRAIVPMFPFKSARFERMAKRFNPNTIYDFYDADYHTNHKLVFETVAAAAKVTVASHFLRDKFKPINPETHFVRFSIDQAKYKQRKSGVQGNQVRIGWMGSPFNAKELNCVSDQLLAIENEFPNVIFTFVCRALPELNLKRHEILQWGDENFDYYDWLAQLDIGIVPFLEDSDVTKAKISMKSIEFMVANVPQVVSPWIHSDQLVHGESGLIPEEKGWYEHVRLLVNDAALRDKLAAKAVQVYARFHERSQVYGELKRILLDRK